MNRLSAVNPYARPPKKIFVCAHENTKKSIYFANNRMVFFYLYSFMQANRLGRQLLQPPFYQVYRCEKQTST